METFNRSYLVQIREHQLVAHIEDGEVLYMQDRLKAIMQKYGIQIPPGERKKYEGKSIVYLQGSKDSLFEKAFRDIYFQLHMPKNEYEWVSTFD